MRKCTTENFMTRATISFTDGITEWMESQLASGEFSSKSEMTNAGLRLLREKTEARDALLSALAEAEAQPSRTWTREALEAHIRASANPDAA